MSSLGFKVYCFQKLKTYLITDVALHIVNINVLRLIVWHFIVFLWEKVWNIIVCSHPDIGITEPYMQPALNVFPAPNVVTVSTLYALIFFYFSISAIQYCSSSTCKDYKRSRVIYVFPNQLVFSFIAEIGHKIFRK